MDNVWDSEWDQLQADQLNGADPREIEAKASELITGRTSDTR